MVNPGGVARKKSGGKNLFEGAILLHILLTNHPKIVTFLPPRNLVELTIDIGASDLFIHNSQEN